MTEPTPNDWWLIIRVPGELHIYQLGPVPDAELSGPVKERTDAHGVPDDWWASPGSGYDVMLSTGEPHRTLLEQATTVTRLEQG